MNDLTPFERRIAVEAQRQHYEMTVASRELTGRLFSTVSRFCADLEVLDWKARVKRCRPEVKDRAKRILYASYYKRG